MVKAVKARGWDSCVPVNVTLPQEEVEDYEELIDKAVEDESMRIYNKCTGRKRKVGERRQTRAFKDLRSTGYL